MKKHRYIFHNFFIFRAMSDTMELLKKGITHVVILFTENSNDCGTKTVELIPRSWLTFINNEWFSYYPDESEYKFITQWVKESKEPDKINWKTFRVTILKKARK